MKLIIIDPLIYKHFTLLFIAGGCEQGSFPPCIVDIILCAKLA